MKNAAEIQGMRNAYLRDGRATVRTSYHLMLRSGPIPIIHE